MSERGFSLVDALIASLILVTGIGALVQLFVIASRSATVAAQMTAAAALAAQKVEELRSEAWEAQRDGDDRAGEFTRRWSVELLEVGAAQAHVIQVSVTPGDVHLVTLSRKLTP